MKTPLAKWMRLVSGYWVFMLAIIYLEIVNMSSDWAGLPGFLLTLPLSAFVVAGYFLASYASEVRGYDIHFTEYQVEYGFIICALLNGFLFYPFHRWWLGRRDSRVSQPPAPPDFQG
jgi:hypothetical protein